MKKRRVWRYTCEHCKKSSCSGGSMKTHELRCFRNPARECPVCTLKWPTDLVAEPMKALENVDEKNEEAVIAALREAVAGCPACMCSAIMQAKLPVHTYENTAWNGDWLSDSHVRYRVKWDYAKERDGYRAEQMADQGHGPEPVYF